MMDKEKKEREVAGIEDGTTTVKEDKNEIENEKGEDKKAGSKPVKKGT